jgi:hypothetical protein
LGHDLPYLEKLADEVYYTAWTASHAIAPIRTRLAKVEQALGSLKDESDELRQIMERAKVALSLLQRRTAHSGDRILK